MSQRGNRRSVEAEVQRIHYSARRSLGDGDLSMDEFEALALLVDGAESAFLEGEIDRQRALEKLHQAESKLQGSL